MKVGTPGGRGNPPSRGRKKKPTFIFIPKTDRGACEIENTKKRKQVCVRRFPELVLISFLFSVDRAALRPF